MKIKGLDNIPCLGYMSGTPIDGYDFDCGYDESFAINCEDCVCNFGNYDPRTGKRINWILRIIQNCRATKHYAMKSKECDERCRKDVTSCELWDTDNCKLHK